ncbi:MAG: cytochrome c biogenesis protein CcdA [Magnetococcus sp. WYHC-3]
MAFQEATFATALGAGILSFVSPCVLPLVPAYISYMTGVSVDQLREESGRSHQLGLRAAWVSLAFVLGFSTVFVLFGASAFALGQALAPYRDLLAKIGGVLIILLGLHYLGLFRLGWLNLEARFNLQTRAPGAGTAYLIGLAFAFGWTPCVGPILATILALAGSQETVWQGVGLLAVYSLGLGIPFILAGLAINGFLGFFRRMRRHMHRVEQVSGGLLVGVGLVFLLGNLSVVSVWLLEYFPALAEVG